MERGGSIVIMGSMSSFIVYPGETVYSASKGAVLQLARGMAGDLAEAGIRGQRSLPRNLRHTARAGSSITPTIRLPTEAEYNAAAPLGRMGTAEEIARATLFLAADESSYASQPGPLTQLPTPLSCSGCTRRSS